LALLAVGALLLIALYAHGKWQERRLLRRMRERLHGGVGDALLQAAAVPRRQEPGFFGTNLSTAVPDKSGAGRTADQPADESAWPDALGATAGPARSGIGSAAAGVGPSWPAGGSAAAAGSSRPGVGSAAAAAAAAAYAAGEDTPFAMAAAEEAGEQTAAPPMPAQVTSEALRTPPALLQPSWTEDPLLDCSLEIRCAHAVDGVSVIDAASALAHASWPLPVNFVVWDGRHQQWVLPDRFGYYTDALASLQLADRRTRIDAAGIEQFVRVVQELAVKLDADVDVPDTGRLLAMAADLDRLCTRFDIRIGLTVESTGPYWTGPQLRNAAHETGFVATGAQRWVCKDADGEPLYTLQVDPAVMNRALLELDIAVAPVASQAFRAMVESAWALAGVLGARVVDDNGVPIDARSVDAIDAQLSRVYADMRAAGIEPGSTRARRLYP